MHLYMTIIIIKTISMLQLYPCYFTIFILLWPDITKKHNRKIVIDKKRTIVVQKVNDHEIVNDYAPIQIVNSINDMMAIVM